MKPIVSIIIPVYNGSNYLKEAIESALAQTYKNIEILVIDDGSTDGSKTAKIAQSYLPKIRYFRKTNGGVASALNLGIQKMQGEYFSWLSHDDVYLPNKISEQLKQIKKYPPKTVLYSNFELINEKGKHLKNFKFKPPPAHFIYYLIDERFIHGCTVFVSKKALQKAGPFNEKLRNVQDYEMWFRLMKSDYVFRHVPRILVKARIHSSQGVNLQRKRQLAEEDQLYCWLLKNFPLENIFDHVENDHDFKYLNLALKFKKNSLFKAASLSRWLALRYLNKYNLRRKFKLLIKTFKKDL
ncbi:MAG: glycosyltransferase [Patescibacteria group bacterium]|nr:glycosyltransferase [Patescibacteria group bacterium]